MPIRSQSTFFFFPSDCKYLIGLIVYLLVILLIFYKLDKNCLYLFVYLLTLLKMLVPNDLIDYLIGIIRVVVDFSHSTGSLLYCLFFVYNPGNLMAAFLFTFTLLFFLFFILICDR